ncbi:ABC transporter permease [Pseudophaeobacter leonis]|uniref:ABC transporter permease n=1 Tax=Pseudophaeobacter leonis TaxID=1144477 RepID=UPI001F4EF4D0|nr:ABC transporter permease [Pseudophaeobacter leonis]
MDRSDLNVSFTQPVSDKTLFELRRIPGVTRVEAVRYVPAVLRHGRESHRGAITGLPQNPVSDLALNRALDEDMAPIEMPKTGVILSSVLAEMLDIKAGEILTVEVREGRQPDLEIPVAGIAQALLGSPAYMDLDALNQALREPRRVSGAFLTIDAAQADAIYETLQDMPTIAGLSVKDEARDAFEVLMDTGAGAIRYVMGAIAFVITFGIVYNSARIAYAERARDLASLRVIGFTRVEVGFVLLGELAVVTLISLPVGAALGYFLSFGIAAGFSTDLYQIPAIFDPVSYGQAMLVVLCAAVVSGWLVKRDLDRSDLVKSLKTRE